MQVSGERAKSANARHECFVMDASVSVKTAETAELDDEHSSVRRRPRRSLHHGKGEVSRAMGETLARRPTQQPGRLARSVIRARVPGGAHQCVRLPAPLGPP
jgi:hypothetical protein